MAVASDYVDVRAEVASALADAAPVVALESSLIAQGLPYPHNVETALAMEDAVRSEGATPATTGVIDGAIRIGLTVTEINAFAKDGNVSKASRRDLAALLASGEHGATTVASTLVCASLAGIRVLATGGIGGVHRGGEQSLDISADLVELARAPVAVVCSGAKAILDLPRTMEVLESHSVPVIGYGVDALPAFYTRSSGLRLAHRVDSADAAAQVMRAQWAVAGNGGIIFANPVPAAAAVDPVTHERWLEQAMAALSAESVTGAAVTPFLLDQLARLSDGRTREANIALLQNNACVAAQIAVADARHRT